MKIGIVIVSTNHKLALKAQKMGEIHLLSKSLTN